MWLGDGRNALKVCQPRSLFWLGAGDINFIGQLCARFQDHRAGLLVLIKLHMQYYINLTYQFRECTEIGFMGHHHILSTKGGKHISPVTNVTLCGTIFLEKPVVTHLVRKFPQFCWTQRFVLVWRYREQWVLIVSSLPPPKFNQRRA